MASKTRILFTDARHALRHAYAESPAVVAYALGGWTVYPPTETAPQCAVPESLSGNYPFELLSFLSISRMEANLMNARALRLRFSKSLANRRHRLSQAKVRSTTQRLGRT